MQVQRLARVSTIMTSKIMFEIVGMDTRGRNEMLKETLDKRRSRSTSPGSMCILRDWSQTLENFPSATEILVEDAELEEMLQFFTN